MTLQAQNYTKKGILGMAENGVIDFEYAENLRRKMGFNKDKFCEFMKISRSTYYAWNYRGIPGGVQFLLRLVESNIGNAVNVRLLM
jgi:DNA-binding transcriptional regulator YiaG